jgi:integrase
MIKSKTKRAKQWPRIYTPKHRSGQVSYQVDLGLVEGKRKRVNFPTREAAETFAEQSRIARANEGTAAFALPQDVRLDAAKAHRILAPHTVSILEAAKYYEKHVLAYKTAPLVKEIVERYIADSMSRNLRPRTISDVKNRLKTFAADFGDCRLNDITLDELKEWVNDDAWQMRTRINFLTKISQLYGYAWRQKWVDANLTSLIDRPTADETTPQVFTVEQAKRLLVHAHQFGFLPYIALGMFAGVRSAEMMRLNGRNINFEEKTITVGADAAKKRSQRIVDMQPALLSWLKPCVETLKMGGPIVEKSKFWKNKELLMEAAEIQEWPANGLRHSFGSYHFAMFRSSDDTAHEMGNSVDMVHRHYKSLVSKSEAEKYWNLRPSPTPEPPQTGTEPPKPAL